MTRQKTLTIAKMGIMAALSVLLVAFIHFPLFPAAPFLEYDPADIPIFITTFALGPLYGLALTVIAALIQGFTVSMGSGVYGIIMHIISTGTFVVTAGCIYKHKKTLPFALISLVSGVIVTAAVMAAANLIITPLFMGAPRSAVAAMLIPVIIPFNLLKMAFNSVITLLIYKRISGFLK